MIALGLLHRLIRMVASVGALADYAFAERDYILESTPAHTGVGPVL